MATSRTKKYQIFTTSSNHFTNHCNCHLSILMALLPLNLQRDKRPDFPHPLQHCSVLPLTIYSPGKLANSQFRNSSVLLSIQLYVRGYFLNTMQLHDECRYIVKTIYKKTVIKKVPTIFLYLFKITPINVLKTSYNFYDILWILIRHVC